MITTIPQAVPRTTATIVRGHGKPVGSSCSITKRLYVECAQRPANGKGANGKGKTYIYFRSCGFLLGLPRGRSAACRSRRLALAACQSSSPNGGPRRTLSRSAASSLEHTGG